MDFDEAVAGLPAKYAEALRLRCKGLTAAEIAVLLDVPPESVGTLLRLAEAKLAGLGPIPPTGTRGPHDEL